MEKRLRSNWDFSMKASVSSSGRWAKALETVRQYQGDADLQMYGALLGAAW